ncbi:MAG: hypothetical protein GAK35_01031 [Herbaspirillum frisingense]|uniref:Helix-turn-helix domain-containing protein n=1 Tax=Herbaspirillum frisingense TaxID=92645 RepID=A0A7V8JV53_9BURK|nr:MAG: hypothetical protein GAK35_01031 [Herbaspirillum frisingense]
MKIISQTPQDDGAVVYRINVAQAKLGVSRATIYRMVDAGTLELVKISARASAITAASIKALVEKNKVRP